MRTIAVIALLLTACAPQPPLPSVAKGKCFTAKLDDLLGKPATLALVNDARERSGASTARVLGPGQIVSMEYRAERLTVHIDAKGRVVRFICG